MRKKTRLIVLLICAIIFLIITPVLVLYSMGYRIDLKNIKVTLTGGIYVKTYPTADKVVIDSKINEKPGLFSGSVFVQSLLPNNHTVLVQKNGYYEYYKSIPVKGKQVTELTNIILIKKDLNLNKLSDSIEFFSISPNNQNIVSVSNNKNGKIINYFPVNQPSQIQIFPLSQTGTTTNIIWSDDSNSLIIVIKNLNNYYYYLLNPGASQGTITRLTYLDKNSKDTSFAPQNSQTILYLKGTSLYSATRNVPTVVLNKVLASTISGQNIIWLSMEGKIFESDIIGTESLDITPKNFAFEKQKQYEILNYAGIIFIEENGHLFKMDQNKKILINIDVPINAHSIILSPDNHNLLFQNSSKVYLYSIAENKFTLMFSGENIRNCLWVNPYYIGITYGDNIIISEIDSRGNINSSPLPSVSTISPTTQINITNPNILFDQQDGKMYILTNGILLSSERITP